MFVAEKFLHSLVKDYGKTSNLNRWCGTWYPYVCKLLNIKHHLHSSYEKSIIERTIQYVKDRIECFDDDYFPCTRSKCKLNHVKNWFNLFVYYYNKEVIA
jgi:putative transposase